MLLFYVLYESHHVQSTPMTVGYRVHYKLQVGQDVNLYTHAVSFLKFLLGALFQTDFICLALLEYHISIPVHAS